MQRLSLWTMINYSIANAGANMLAALSNTALPLYLGSYGVPNVVIGFLAQERSFVGGFVQPVVGALSDRTRTRLGRRRPYFLIGIPLTVAGVLALAFHPPLWVVLLILPVLAFFLAVAYDPYLALMADITPPEQRGRMGGIMGVLNMVGQMVLLGVAAALWATQEFAVFAITCAGLIITFGITFFTIKEPPLTDEPEPAPLRFRPRQYIANVLAHRELTKYVFSQFFFWFGTGAAVPFLTRFAVEVLGADEGTAFLLVLVAVIATAVASVPAGMAGDRWGRQRVLSIGLLAFAVTGLVGSQAQTVLQGAIIMALFGAVNSMAQAMVYPLLCDLMPRGRLGEFTGLGTMVWSLAQPVGSTAAGLAIDVTGSYRTVFVVSSIMIFISYLLLLTVRPELAQTGDAAEGETVATGIP